MRRRRQTHWIDPYRHESWTLDANRPRHLASPHRQQPAHHSVSPRDLGYVRAFFETLGDNPRLLLGRPPAPPTLPCDQFDPAIPPSSFLASSMEFLTWWRCSSGIIGFDPSPIMPRSRRSLNCLVHPPE
jgi:hypothetical protein